RKEIPEAAPNVRALWLSCSGGPNWKLIGQALQSGSPGMRENALVLSEGGEAPDAVLSRIVRMVVEDPHPRVRFQAALSLGSRSHPGKVPALAGLLLRDGGYLWSRRAVWTAVAGNAGDLLRQLRGLRGFSAEGFDSLRAVVLEELVELAANEASSRADFYEWLAGVDLKSWRLEDQVGLLRGLRGSWSYRPPAEEARGRARACLRRFSGELSGSEEALLALHRILDEPLPSGLEASWRSAAGRARDPGLDVAERRRCVALLAEVPEGEARATLLTLLDSKVPAVLQESALEALSRNRPEDLGRKILAQWRGISPRFRPRLIQLLLRKSGDRIALLDALDARQITVQELNLDLEQRRTLLRWSSPEIARRSQPYFGDHEYSNRKALVEEWLRKLPARGDPEIGRAAFQRSCAVCHRVGKDGHAVGPDLTGVSHRSVEDLLSHILDPNMAINPNYVTCMVETHDGTILTGLLSSESENELTLTLQQGTRQRIARKAIKRKEVLPVSLMPEGMEEAFTPAEMRSLIEFLQNS
ncbi:MAG: c-type cytochrome, partial [Akkermansiaceae bacterium]|nr:c-type cytochrome [Akkermansiaceae bacterium]